jgi:hypothetical protein
MDDKLDIGQLTVNEAINLYKSLKEKLKPLRVGSSNAGRKPKYDYETWDWGKKNTDLVMEHGANYQLVCRKRLELGKARVPGGKHYPACLGWDYSKSDTEIAREHKLDLGTVKKFRRYLGKPSVPRDEHIIYKEPLASYQTDWAALDWNRCDYDIAKEAGCTREYIRQKRAKLGLPKLYAYELKYKAFAESFAGVKELTYPEARMKWPRLSGMTFKRYCQKAGIKVVRKSSAPQGKWPWAKMDWRLPNKLLSVLWNVPNNKVAMWRSNHPNVERSLFTFWASNGAIPTRYREMVEAQRALAEEHQAIDQAVAVAYVAAETQEAESHSEVPQ